MAISTEDLKEESSVWSSELLLDKGLGMNFICIECKGIPKICMNNEDGEVLCKKCSNDMDNTATNKMGQNMINKLKVKCPSLYTGDDTNKNEGGNVVVTQVTDNQCDWNGIIKEIDDHINECGYIIINCAVCGDHECARKDMNDHIPQCPDAVIVCPLSCGMCFFFVFFFSVHFW